MKNPTVLAITSLEELRELIAAGRVFLIASEPICIPGVDAQWRVPSIDAAFKQLGHERRILRMKDLPKRTGLSRATLYNLRNTDPNFPRPVQLTVHAVGYYEHDVDAWLDARAQSEMPVAYAVNKKQPAAVVSGKGEV